MFSLAAHRESRLARGFTLVEILIVVGILAILVVLAIPSYYGSRRSTLESSAVGGLKAIAEAEELYYNLNSYYPGGTSEDHWNRLRSIDAIDPKGYGRPDTVDGFIKGYSIAFFSNGPYPQDYSITVTPVVPETGLRTFALINGRLRDSQTGVVIW
ncbi:MAG: hypothetical protein GEEBNDBF_01355 [bacterium]|nr:hypothetical protein [bacterium]